MSSMKYFTVIDMSVMAIIHYLEQITKIYFISQQRGKVASSQALIWRVSASVAASEHPGAFQVEVNVHNNEQNKQNQMNFNLPETTGDYIVQFWATCTLSEKCHFVF